MEDAGSKILDTLWMLILEDGDNFAVSIFP
jgi:hypothetical protein